MGARLAFTGYFFRTFANFIFSTKSCTNVNINRVMEDQRPTLFTCYQVNLEFLIQLFDISPPGEEMRDLQKCGQYNWGSIILANLYQELCLATNIEHKEISGASLLIQVCARDRFSCLGPNQHPKSFIGKPFATEYVLEISSITHLFSYYLVASTRLGYVPIWNDIKYLVSTTSTW
ncbi:hypothetical protein CR513_24421, partial [Mucuna pruriens]